MLSQALMKVTASSLLLDGMPAPAGLADTVDWGRLPLVLLLPETPGDGRSMRNAAASNGNPRQAMPFTPINCNISVV
jgi:hypothetical protein